MGRTLTSQVGSLPATNYTYSDSGTWSVKVCSPVQGTNTVCQKSILDSQGRAVTRQVLDGGGTLYSASDTQYDSFGRAYKASNPYIGSASYWTQTYFDTLGRVYQTTLPDNSSSTINYTDNSAVTTDPTGKQRKAVADGLGRLTSVYEPDPSNNNTLTLQTSYTYNVLGELTQVAQGSQTRSYVYDALGRILSSTTPEGGRTCFGSVTGSTCNADGYDGFNNLLKRTDARGVLTSYGYDGINRLSTVSYNVGSTGVPATPTVSLAYGVDSTCTSAHGSGCIGQVITMTDGPGSENYTYNSLEQLTQLQKVISGTTYTTLYAYNLAGELTQITYPSNRVIQQSVDAIGRLCEIAPSTSGCGTASSPYATGYGYSAVGQLTGFRYGNGIYASLGFSSDRLQLNCLDYSTTNRGSTCAHDGTTKFGLDYSYGGVGANNGQIAGTTDAVDAGRSAAYSYDALYRFTSAVTTGSTGYPKWGISETYDRFGNRSDQNQTFGNPPMNHVTIDTATNRISGDCYDLNGNLLAESAPPCPSPTYTYDAENHLVNYMNANPTYVYDGNGLRVKKCIPNCISPTTTTVYIFSGSKVIAEYDNGSAVGSPSREYIYSGSALLAKVDPSGTSYYHQDHLSNRLVTNSTGVTLAQMGHYPFGETWYNSTADKLFFTSFERDAESGNDYAQARYYVSRLGRFESPDPIGGDSADPQSLNRYIYTRDDPLNLADPQGLHYHDCDWEGDCGWGRGESGYYGGGGSPCALDGLDVYCGSLSGLGSNGTMPVAPVVSGPRDTVYVQDGGGNWLLIRADGTVIPLTKAAVEELGLSDFDGDPNTLVPWSTGDGGGGAANNGPANSPANPPPCQAKVLNATNNQFGTNYTDANVNSIFNFSTGAPPGQGTLNLNIYGSTAGVSPGYYPVHWWTYAIGYGPTLHAVSGPGGNGGLDSTQTLPFGPNQATFHIDSGFPYNPIGAFFHWLLNMTKAGGYPQC